ncbi:MAG: tetratricopeptide repeat protein [Nitrospirae bacterium]|nr:tetratricopeptide repeat protein [Nitrospirota bacterium]
MKYSWSFSLLLLFIVFAIYGNSLGNDFVWDDAVVIVKNPLLKGDALSLFAAIDSGREIDLTPYYRPLTFLSFLVEERLHGLKPFPMHLLNVLLHTVNAFLVYRLARFIIKDEQASFFAALLFAVHPISNETVDFLSCRNTLLACFFALMAYLFHIRSAVAGAVFFLAALFSKEIGLMILPFIVAQEISSARNISGYRYRSLIRLIPYVFCTGAYLALRGNAIDAAGVKIDILSGLGTRLLDNLYIIPRYVLAIVWPSSISIRYYVPDDIHLLALPLVFAWIGICGVLVWLMIRCRTKATLFGLAWLVSFLLPVSGIIPIPSASMADRYLYVPAIGLWIVIGDQYSRLISSQLRYRRYFLIASVFILVFLSVVTVIRNNDWKNDVTLFSHYAKQNPDSAFAHHNLGCAYLDKVGNLDAAEREFFKAIDLNPSFPRLWTQMGYISLLRGNYELAVSRYDEAISQNPFDAEAYLNRAIAFDRLGKYEYAVADYRRFLAIPGNELADARPQATERMRELAK